MQDYGANFWVIANDLRILSRGLTQKVVCVKYISVGALQNMGQKADTWWLQRWEERGFRYGIEVRPQGLLQVPLVVPFQSVSALTLCWTESQWNTLCASLVLFHHSPALR